MALRGERVLTIILCIALVLSGCLSNGAVLSGEGEAWPEADALFDRDPHWLGSDGGFSVPLSEDRFVLLFGDSLIDPDGKGEREGSVFVSNVVAEMQGANPEQASFSVHWQPPEESGEEEQGVVGNPTEDDDQGETGKHHAFFPDDGNVKYWPTGGILLNGSLLVFSHQVLSGDDQWSFSSNGYGVFEISNPHAEIQAWEPEKIHASTVFDGNVTLGLSLVERGPYLLAYGVHSYENEDGRTSHDPVLARWTLEDVQEGRLEDPDWYRPSNDDWIPQKELSQAPDPLIAPGTPDYTVHYDDELDTWVHIQATGFGSTSIEARTAPAPTGPFSDPTVIYEPPENKNSDLFTYSALAHPSIEGSDLVLTYSVNAFQDATNESKQRGYTPHFVNVDIERE
jgi:hypothetical protein